MPERPRQGIDDAGWKAEIGPIIKEDAEPVKNLVEKFNQIYYWRSMVTTPRGRFARSPEQPGGKERPLFLRAKRAELYHKVKKLPRDQRRAQSEEIFSEAHLRDAIAEQYLNQKEVRVTIEGLGEQRARVIDLAPPEEYRTSESSKEPPIFLVPGISNDVECVNTMVNEMAKRGRRVIVVGYPESFKGQTTSNFAEAVEKLLGEEKPVELWGLSTGAPIVSNILNDPSYQERVPRAVLVCPAASVDQTTSSLNLGALHDLGSMKERGSSAYLNWTIESKTPREKEQVKLRERIFGELIKKITKRNDAWKNARVREGGSIVVVSGREDKITKSAERNKDFSNHPQMHVLDLPNGYHASPQVDAERVIPAIFEAQKKNA